jgi:drug/metabolite transporter (DMT)-like permease
LLGEALTWRKVAGLLLGISGVGFIVWHRMSVGTDSPHGILFTLASLASIVVGTILFKLLAPKGSLWVGNGIQNGGLVLLMPPLGMLFAFLVLGEHVELCDLVGIIPVALGIYLVTRPAAAVNRVS